VSPSAANIEQREIGKAVYRRCKAPYLIAVLRRNLQEFGFHPVDIGVDADRFPPLVLQPEVFFGLDEIELVDVEHFPPFGVQCALGVRADQPVQARLKSVFAPAPAGRQSASDVVLFKHFNLIAGLLPVDGRAQPGNPTTDNDDLSRALRHSAHTR
jgi:hypothetical protein